MDKKLNRLGDRATRILRFETGQLHLFVTNDEYGEMKRILKDINPAQEMREVLEFLKLTRLMQEAPLTLEVYIVDLPGFDKEKYEKLFLHD